MTRNEDIYAWEYEQDERDRRSQVNKGFGLATFEELEREYLERRKRRDEEKRKAKKKKALEREERLQLYLRLREEFGDGQ